MQVFQFSLFIQWGSKDGLDMGGFDELCLDVLTTYLFHWDFTGQNFITGFI